jgi:two-component system NtrC family response regulator
LAIKKILIIDDEERLRSLISRILELEGYKVYQAGDGKSAIGLLDAEDIGVVIADVRLPDINGIELIKLIKGNNPAVEVINLTAYGNIADGVQAIKNGAFDYIVKGDDNDKIIPLVAKAMDKALLQLKVQQLEKKLEDRFSFDTILGTSAEIHHAIDMARKVSVTDTTVLLTGETGTGKEVFAQAIHYNSKRKDQNLVIVNCSAFAEDLLESELFGYKKGAFTGAIKDKKGLFEEADNGTIFLDEIGEMNVSLQAKLLRVLENGTFIKVGDTKNTNVNVRIIAATNRELQKEISSGTFREDLFYRLSVFAIHLPALRERKQDITALSIFFIQQFSLKLNKPVPASDKQFLRKLEQSRWKGNIRELKNVIERTLILNDSPVLTLELLPLDLQLDDSDSPFSDLATAEKKHIERIFRSTGGNKTETARLLNIGLSTLYRKLEEYNI